MYCIYIYRYSSIDMDQAKRESLRILYCPYDDIDIGHSRMWVSMHIGKKGYDITNVSRVYHE